MPKLSNDAVATVLADIANAMMSHDVNGHTAHIVIDIALIVTDFVEKQTDNFQELYQSKLNFVEE